MILLSLLAVTSTRFKSRVFLPFPRETEGNCHSSSRRRLFEVCRVPFFSLWVCLAIQQQGCQGGPGSRELEQVVCCLATNQFQGTCPRRRAVWQSLLRIRPRWSLRRLPRHCRLAGRIEVLSLTVNIVRRRDRQPGGGDLHNLKGHARLFYPHVLHLDQGLHKLLPGAGELLYCLSVGGRF